MRSRRLAGWAALILGNSLVLFFFDHRDTPPRTELEGVLYLGNVLLHLVLGLFAFGPFFLLLRAFLRRWRGGPFRVELRLVGGLALASLAVCLGTGVYLLWVGNLRPQRPFLWAHMATAALSLVLGTLYAGLWVRQKAPSLRDEGLWWWRWGRWATVLALALPLLFLGLKGGVKTPANTIENPRWPPESAWEEGDGKEGPFFPSSVQTKHKGFFPPEYFTDSASCGKSGCHPDLYRQWFASAHHFSSFNNQWYRKSIEYMQEVAGTRPTKWCGGCHDPAVLLTEMPGTGRSRMDFPIKDQVWPPKAFPTSHAGLGCASCHSIVQVKSTMGQADFLLDFPPLHRYAVSSNPLLRAAHDFLIRRAPAPHKKTFLKPFHTDAEQVSKFCSACHKVHLDEPVNHFRWLRGFNEYDSWQASGVSGYGAQSFYYPRDPRTGQPAFKTCVDCHMPPEPSRDAGALPGENGSWVHSHRFLAANTALPFSHGWDGKQWSGGSEELLTKTDANNYMEQFARTVGFLRGMQGQPPITVDIFALRRQRGKAKEGPLERKPSSGEEPPRAASLFGEEGWVRRAGPREVEEDMVAPLNGGEVVRRGETVLVEVVVRTRNIGHAFPGGTIDAFDAWLELKAEDNRGRVLFWSGFLEEPDGPVDRWAHFYRSLLLDAHGNPINKRNAFMARVALYSRRIPPGAADVVHYRLHIPPDCGEEILIIAKLNYRKFHWFNTHFAFAGRPLREEKTGRWLRKAHGEGLGFAEPVEEGTLRRANAYGKDGRLEQVAAGLEGGDEAFSVHWDDRQWAFDAETSQVSALVQAVPKLPIITIAEDEVILRVGGGPPTPPSPSQKGLDRERWNDYGIGLFLQGDFRRALWAFRKVTEIDPDWPEGWVNLGRVQLAEGNLAEAEEALRHALALYGRRFDPMTPYLRARTLFFLGQVLKDTARLAEAERLFREVLQVFPQDRAVRNQLGRLLFVQGRFQEAIEEFRHTLRIDPEDVAAHYNLSLCYKGVGDRERARRHERLYHRFKADETQTRILGPYVLRNPWDNQEAQPIHEHTLPPGWKPPKGNLPLG